MEFTGDVVLSCIVQKHGDARQCARGHVVRSDVVFERQGHGPENAVGGAELAKDIAGGARRGVGQKRIGDSPEQIVGVSLIAGLGEQLVAKRRIPGDQSAAGLCNEGPTSRLHDGLVIAQFRHCAAALQRAQEAQQCVDGVVAVELGLFEGQQIVLLDEHVDAGSETWNGGPADENVAELLDEERPVDPRDDGRQVQRGNLGRIGHYPAHLADHRVEKLHPLRQ